MQTSTSASTRVCRLHRQYPNTSNNPIPTSTPRQISGAEEATEAHSEVGDPATGHPTPRETTDIVLRLHVDTAAHGPTGQEKNARPQTKSATIVGDLNIFQKFFKSMQTKIRLSK